ncbi:murein hydrolase activator EnvC family protein [Shewanella sp. YIC-542]|uniref:murein hydrolase activator EnvC family protein n=1 Tax=Shewanella mytili TaxID=3377111 RepID=UPI00398E9467
MHKHAIAKASIFAGFLIFSHTLQASSLEQRQSQLKQIQQQIAAQQNDLKDSGNQREKLLKLLKQDEQAIGVAARQVSETEHRLNASQQQLATLTQQAQTLLAQQQSQQQTLARQLKSAFLAGNHDYSKLLLHQQDPTAMERMLAYYEFLNKARMDAINQLKQTREQLNLVQQQQQQETAQLNQLALAQRAQSEKLKKEQQQRQNTLGELQQVIDSKASELEQLQIEEASLKRVIDAAMKAMRDTPSMNGLAQLGGKLSWPTKGKMSNRFGSRRSGKVNWKGVVIDAIEGQAIKSIAPGKVIYADWLRGFGLLLVIDHGKGYMSLYGHAQALLKDVGDSVHKDDTIALVGRSGGQSKPSLYFEIRHKGEAVDPARYCRR